VKIHIIKNDAECVQQLRLYFLLLLKADKMQSKLEKKISKTLHTKSIQMKSCTLKKYHRLSSLSRVLNVLKQNISYYLISIEKEQVKAISC